MPSVVDVVNRAVLSIGGSPIISIDQPGTTAESAKILYPQVRDEVLRSHPWNCAKARTTLLAELAAPVFGWGFSYPLPADCLRVLVVNDRSWLAQPIGREPEGWEIEGRKLLTHEAGPIEVEYVRREEDVNKWDAELVAAVAAALASALAPKITATTAIQDRADARAAAAIIHAKISDGHEQDMIESDYDDPWLAVRF